MARADINYIPFGVHRLISIDEKWRIRNSTAKRGRSYITIGAYNVSIVKKRAIN